MDDRDCVEFLQWALPQLHLRWPGFRKVRRQVCRRIDRRLRELGLAGTHAYRDFLTHNPAEWSRLDSLCPITISTFYRDKAVFDCIRQRILPEIAQAAGRRGESTIRAWSIGCASGEEPYTLMLIWKLATPAPAAELALHVLATDVGERVLDRARTACYGAGSLKLLPAGWREQAFDRVAERYCLRTEYRTGVDFLAQDIRADLPPGGFDLILCRNLVFTYFSESLQRQILPRLLARLRPGGFLIIGQREALPDSCPDLEVWTAAPGIFHRPERQTSAITWK
jgi:chemotaxis protein methyltransferase CheR